MLDDDPFGNIPVIGAMPPRLAAQLLREIGEGQLVSRLDQGHVDELRGTRFPAMRRFRWPFQDKPWQYTTHTTK